MSNKNQFKIYIDEDSLEFGKHLREVHNLNIIFPKNLGKSILDESQLRLANSQNAFILTKNENDFVKKIPNVLDKVKNSGIIVWNTNNYRDICNYILYLRECRCLELKGKIYIINKEGIRVLSRKGESKIIGYPCMLCNDKCKIRKNNLL